LHALGQTYASSRPAPSADNDALVCAPHAAPQRRGNLSSRGGNAGAHDGGPDAIDAPTLDEPSADLQVDLPTDRPADLRPEGPAQFTVVEFPVPTERSMPLDITSGPDGNLWFTENYGNKIGRITLAGVITEFAVPTAMSQPSGIAPGSDGHVWFTESTGNKIGRITPMGTITEFDLPTANSRPGDMTLGPEGNVWFAEAGAERIGQITPTGAITEFPVDAPWYLTAGPGGNIWFTQVPMADSGGFGTRIVAKMTTTGTVTPFPNTIPNCSPMTITAGADGNLWFVDPTTNFAIGRMTPTGDITEFPMITQGTAGSASPPGPTATSGTACSPPTSSGA
jgi:streptogramin lyase